MKLLMYGYLRLTDDLDDHEIRRMEQGLQELAEAGGFCFATTFHEYQTGYHGGFDELTHELQRAHAQHVVMPSLEHLSAHPLLQDMMLTRLAREADAYVWVAARRDQPTEHTAAVLEDRTSSSCSGMCSGWFRCVEHPRRGRGEGLPEERVGTVAAAVFSGVQDDIAEVLTQAVADVRWGHGQRRR